MLTAKEWEDFFDDRGEPHPDFRFDIDLSTWHRLEIEPMPTPRPRMRVIKSKKGAFASVYNDKKYIDYKKALTILIKSLRIPKRDYFRLDAYFYLPYPKSTAKMRRIDNMPHRKKPDKDNYEKALMDALESAGILFNDGQVSDGEICKRYTTESRGFILFNLK